MRLSISFRSSGHNGPHQLKGAMGKGGRGAKGLNGEAEGTRAKYRPQRHVGMLGGKNQAHPCLLPQSNLCLHRGALEAAGGYGSVPSLFKVQTQDLCCVSTLEENQTKIV